MKSRDLALHINANKFIVHMYICAYVCIVCMYLFLLKKDFSGLKLVSFLSSSYRHENTAQMVKVTNTKRSNIHKFQLSDVSRRDQGLYRVLEYIITVYCLTYFL